MKCIAIISKLWYLLVAVAKSKENARSKKQEENTRFETEIIRSYKLNNRITANKYEDVVNKGLENFHQNAEK